MITNTENNHLLYYYNDDQQQKFRTDDLDTTSMTVGGCSRPVMTLKAELIRNARSLVKQYPDLTLFMSGGLDSEMAFNSFLAAGIVPKIAIIRFPNGANDYDVGPTITLLNSKGINFTIIDFDPIAFFNSNECYEIGLKYQAYTFYQQMLLKVAEQYNAPMITIDEVELEKQPTINWETGETKFEWVFLKKEDQDGVWRRFNDKTGIPALNNFYTYSPESMLAFLQEDTVADLIRDKIPHKQGWTSSKMKIYSSLNYEFRPRPKWHGMENFLHIWDAVTYNRSSKGLLYSPRTYTVNAIELEQNLINGKETICKVA
jgi:hypothetical protein